MRRSSAKKFRAYMIVGALSALGVAAYIALTALQDNIVFFKSPSEIMQAPPDTAQRIRIGGMVQQDSVTRDGLNIRFVVTDFNASIEVSYTGMLPDLFREGQGVVAEGRMGTDGAFIADTVLAKHDETYMPPEVAEALERAAQTSTDGAYK